jgi:nitrogen fixation/metabolism regulation signal transduction histidine kinase
MGLGLALVASLVWEAGGDCRIYNREGRPGVMVDISLPLAQPGEEEPPPD